MKMSCVSRGGEADDFVAARIEGTTADLVVGEAVPGELVIEEMLAAVGVLGEADEVRQDFLAVGEGDAHRAVDEGKGVGVVRGGHGEQRECGLVAV